MAWSVLVDLFRAILSAVILYNDMNPFTIQTAVVDDSDGVPSFIHAFKGTGAYQSHRQPPSADTKHKEKYSFSLKVLVSHFLLSYLIVFQTRCATAHPTVLLSCLSAASGNHGRVSVNIDDADQ